MTDFDARSTELVQRIAAALAAKSARLAVAESCTGGWIAKALTDQPGSSAWFGYGFVTYSDEAKQALLGVSAETLAVRGAVSTDVAEQMATGARLASAAEIAVAVTGIAGPGGGTADKPVGTVCFAWAGPGVQLISQVQRFSGDRDAVRRQGVIAALEGVLVQLTAP
ncbi:nicotinamide-nucleotide amidase [Gammaproteobacteria bacterium]|nr:nicotinamide-nucleotide amidohydrolase family protein [Gammaproteobacteria bacterium]QOJ30843.1 MAG: nicotinamide-nucleotide amidohydrolase family protein [Gammaproteobacteria bacterium]CAG0940637.1 nicotinamide-nucleotide amidase [Gammaproteobacteria bacterium]